MKAKGKKYPDSKKCQRCGSSHPPKKCPAFGKECMKCKKKGHYAKMCRTKMPEETGKSKDSSKYSQKQKSQGKKKLSEATAHSSSEDFSDFEAAEVNIDSIEAEESEQKTEESTVFCKKLPKHVKEIFLDDDLGPDTQYAVVRLVPEDGQKPIKLKGKVDTGAQVNLINISTFQKIFGKDAEKKLHSSSVKLTGYGRKKFTNHGKFRLDKVHHHNVTG